MYGEDGDIRFLRSVEDVRAIITPRMEDGPFLSIYVRGHEIVWRSSEELAIRCAEDLGKTVRWWSEAANSWFEKQGTQEMTAIEWGD